MKAAAATLEGLEGDAGNDAGGDDSAERGPAKDSSSSAGSSH